MKQENGFMSLNLVPSLYLNRETFIYSNENLKEVIKRFKCHNENLYHHQGNISFYRFYIEKRIALFLLSIHLLCKYSLRTSAKFSLI